MLLKIKINFAPGKKNFLIKRRKKKLNKEIFLQREKKVAQQKVLEKKNFRK